MTRPISKDHLSIIEEFKRYGFTKLISGDKYLLTILRREYRDSLRIFKSGYGVSAGRTGSMYGTYDIFGDKVLYYYDIRRKEEFVDFLVRKFFELNPDPKQCIKRVFTKMLHYHGLCWPECSHDGKPRIKRKI